MKTTSAAGRSAFSTSLLPARARDFWHPVYRRRFRSALLVLLGRHAFEQLSDGDKARVESMADQINKEARNILPYMVRQRGADPDATEDWRPVWRARAMAALGMSTGIDGLTWDELSVGKRNPVFDLLPFQRFHPVTDDAVAFLREHGVELDAHARQSKSWLDAMRRRYP